MGVSLHFGKVKHPMRVDTDLDGYWHTINAQAKVFRRREYTRSWRVTHLFGVGIGKRFVGIMLFSDRPAPQPPDR